MRGIPKGALSFFEELEANNNKTWWDANKASYASQVRDPMEELCEAFADVGSFRLFRLHNDMRFAKNKPPYKTHQGAVSYSDAGSGYFIGLDAHGLRVGAGMYMMASDQLEKFRASIDAEATGAALIKLVAALRKGGYEVGAFEELKTAPKGWPKDHPRVEFLRMKGISAVRDLGAGAWLHSGKVVERVGAVWKDVRPLCEWLNTHVGPSGLPNPMER